MDIDRVEGSGWLIPRSGGISYTSGDHNLVGKESEGLNQEAKIWLCGGQSLKILIIFDEIS